MTSLSVSKEHPASLCEHLVVLLKLSCFSREELDYLTLSCKCDYADVIQKEILVIFEKFLDFLPLMSVSSVF